jgi:hypothetical protein
MRFFLVTLVVSIVALLVPIGVVSADKTPPPYLLIVNSANTSNSASRRFVGDAFLKKTTRWPKGEVIRPADLAAVAGVRRRFTEDVLNRSVAAVRSYWQQMVFSGRDLPPPELDSDQEVVKFVIKHPGAIGYVAGDASVVGVKVLGVE